MPVSETANRKQPGTVEPASGVDPQRHFAAIP